MSYRLGRKSLAELEGVEPRLTRVVHRAIKITPVDFSVHDGLRLLEEQKEYVRTGVSRTMDSRHLIQDSGYGEAVDLVPYINNKLRWEWEPIYLIATAMKKAAIEEGLLITWGAVWDRSLNFLTASPKISRAAYIYRKEQLGRTAFTDGPHFEITE